MKRYITFLMSLCLCISLALSPLSAAASSGESSEAPNASSQAPAETAPAEKTTAKKETAAQEESPYEKPVSEENPIGSNGAYYDLDGISGSPDITADSAVVVDATTGYTLYSKQGEIKRYPASITKVMTALIAIENCSMDETVSYTQEILNTVEPGSSSAGIGAGAKLTMEQSLYALMLVSANEAGAAIACHIAGSDAEFAKLMTKRAKSLGCKKTTFKNPHGLPNEKHVTTAHDMALILKKAMEYEAFRTIAGTLSYTIKSDTLPAPIELYNHAKILQSESQYYYKYAKGAKTGFTRAALNTLVTWSTMDDTDLIVVILKDYGADRSYIDSRNLYTWAFDKVKTIHPVRDFDLEAWISENKDQVSKDLRQGIRTLDYTYNKDYPILVKKNFDTKKVSFRFEEKLDKEKGILGTISIYDGDNLMGVQKVTYDAQSVQGQSFKNAGSNDNMRSANISKGKASPHKFLIIIGSLFAVLLITIIIVQLRRARKAELRRKQRIKQRREDHLKGERTPNRSSASGSLRPQPGGKHAR